MDGITYTPKGQWLGFRRLMLLFRQYMSMSDTSHTYNSVINSYRLKYSYVKRGDLASDSPFSSSSYKCSVLDAGGPDRFPSRAELRLRLNNEVTPPDLRLLGLLVALLLFAGGTKLLLRRGIGDVFELLVVL